MKAIALLFFAAQLAFAQDWPQWRGPNRDGAVSSFSEPKTWPQQLKPRWRVKVGEGYSSPVVAGGRVFVLTRQEEREVVSSLDLESGRLLWQDTNPAPYRMNPAATRHGKGPKSTPVIQDGRLYTLGISGILSCLDAATGKLRWRKDFSGQFKETSPLYGVAMSSLVDRGLLIVHVGGNDQGALTAFDTETGKVKWSWTGDGPGYASPIVVELGGTRQVVTQTQENIVGVSAAGGELLWRIPFTTGWQQNIITPALYKDTLIFSGHDKPTMAVRVLKRGNAWSTEKVWENPELFMYMSSPVVSGDLLFGMSHKRRGQFFALDARAGATLWTTTGREGENAAILHSGVLLFILNNNAELIVARKSAKGFTPVRRYTVADSQTWAHPVVLGTRVLIKDTSTLALWSLE